MNFAKKIGMFALAAVISCTGFACADGEPPEGGDGTGDESLVEALYDPTFSMGFNFYGADSRFHAATPWEVLKFDENSFEDPIWKIGTWGCFVNYFLDVETTFSESGVLYTYPANPLEVEKDGDWYTVTNPTNTISVNPVTGSVKLYQDTREEYGVTPSYAEAPRLSNPRKNGEAWPHLLIEQNIVANIRLSEVDAIYFDTAFCVTKCDDYTPQKNHSLHTAQFQWIVSVKCVNTESAFYNKYYWFDIPLYNDNVPHNPQSAHIDGGKEDATGMLIYTVDNYDFIDGGVTVGEHYSARVNLYEQLVDAFETAQEEGLFTDCTLADMKLDTMNMGWENPGTYDTGVEIDHLSIQYHMKEEV